MIFLHHLLTTIIFTPPILSSAQFNWRGSCGGTNSTSTTCSEKGNGEITRLLSRQTVEKLGDIPIGKTNLKINLNSKKSKCIDLQVFDGDFAVIQWNRIHPSENFSFPSIADEFEYKNMVIRYNSLGPSVEIIGSTTRKLQVKAYACEDLEVIAIYEWGTGAGKSCQCDNDCGEGLFCKEEKPLADNEKVGISKYCHESNWCHSHDTASQDCGAGLIESIGTWTCLSNQCQKMTTYHRQLNATNGTDCGNRAGYQDMPLSDISYNFTGVNVSVTSTISIGYAACSYMRCYPSDACCNTCRSGVSFQDVYLIPQKGVAHVGCAGNECDYMNHCTYNDGDEVTVYGEIGPEGDSIIFHDHCKSNVNNIFT